MGFGDWVYSLPDEERESLCLWDAYEAGMNNAIALLKKEKEVLERHKLDADACKIDGLISVIQKNLDDEF